MQENFNFLLLALTSFFTLMNPLNIMPVFMSMTTDLTVKARNRTALKAALVAFFTLMIFMFTGEFMFKFFGISVDSFRIVGGIIFFLMGYDMLQARLTRVKVDNGEVREYVNDISITPLAIPMICGPGAITNGIVMMQDAETFQKKAILVSAIFIVLAIGFLVLRSSSAIMKVLGETGNKILMRLMGLIMMVIAVEFFFAGLSPILKDIFEVTGK